MRASAELELQARLLEATQAEVARREAAVAQREMALAELERTARGTAAAALEKEQHAGLHSAEAEARARMAHQQLQQVRTGCVVVACAWRGVGRIRAQPQSAVHSAPTTRTIAEPRARPTLKRSWTWFVRRPRSWKRSTRLFRPGSSGWRGSAPSWRNWRRRPATRCRRRERRLQMHSHSVTRCAVRAGGPRSPARNAAACPELCRP